MASISESDFDYIRAVVRERSAIVIEPGKEYLVESRLVAVARQVGLAIQDLIDALRSERRDGSLHRQITEAMTTNETAFFRDKHPFDTLRNSIIPELTKHRSAERSLSIWSGACSSGQEPYSISMSLLENFPSLSTWNVKILGTDLSTRILDRARSGTYTQLEVNRGLPAPMLVKYFDREGSRWQIKESVRRRVEFREHNLIGSWGGFESCDVVFLRNVLIYFDVETKQSILRNVRHVLKPDGYLFLGGSETTIGIDDSFGPPPFQAIGCYVPK